MPISSLSITYPGAIQNDLKASIVAASASGLVNTWRFVPMGASELYGWPQFMIQNCATNEYLTWDKRCSYNSQRFYAFKSLINQCDANAQNNTNQVWLLVPRSDGLYQIKDSISGANNLYAAEAWAPSGEQYAFVWLGGDADWTNSYEDSKRWWRLDTYTTTTMSTTSRKTKKTTTSSSKYLMTAQPIPNRANHESSQCTAFIYELFLVSLDTYDPATVFSMIPSKYNYWIPQDLNQGAGGNCFRYLVNQVTYFYYYLYFIIFILKERTFTWPFQNGVMVLIMQLEVLRLHF